MTIYQATYKGDILASGPFDELVRLEGNWYFPPESVELERFEESKTTTVCPWKGTAHYYTLKAVTETKTPAIKDIAWYYPEPKEKATEIKGMVAFYVGRVEGLTVDELKAH